MVHEDGTVLVPTKDGTMKRLPNTGTVETANVTILGIVLMALATFLVKGRKQ